MGRVPRHETKAELALRTVRERILAGELAPGRHLDINQLAAELGMSPTPVREALRVLQADRLVHYAPHRGTVVAGLSERDLAEIFQLRLLLEPAAVEAAVRRLDATLLEELERLHRDLLATDGASTVTYSERNAQWHWALYNGADSPYLADFIRRLWDAFPWRTIAAVAGRQTAQHERIMEAVRAHDATRSAALMRDHVESSRVALRVPANSLQAEVDHAAAQALVALAPAPLRTSRAVAP